MRTPELLVHRALVLESDSVSGNCKVSIPSLLSGVQVSVPPIGLPRYTDGSYAVPSVGESTMVAVSKDNSQVLWLSAPLSHTIQAFEPQIVGQAASISALNSRLNSHAANIGVTAASVSSLSSVVSTLTRRNLLHNGDARVWQRGTAATTGSFAIYGVDRWTVGYANSFTAENTRVDGASTDPVRYWIRAKVNTADASLAAGEYFSMTQAIEGADIAHLRWGTSLAKPVTISFWVKASIAGTYSVTIRNNGASRSYVAPFVVNAANTPEFKTITIPGCTDGTWSVDENVGLVVWFALGQGSTFSTSSTNTWLSANILGPTSGVNMMPTVNSTFDISEVQLEEGEVATPFETRPIAEEVSTCQRYFFIAGLGSANWEMLAQGFADSASSGILWVQTPVTMRTTPIGARLDTAGNFQIWGGTQTATCSTLEVGPDGLGPNGGRFNWTTTTSPFAIAWPVLVRRSSTSAARLSLSAEF